jgi:pimeloyl-ACP methyl ester carboxylesterase
VLVTTEPLVLLPGLLCDAEVWEAQVREFSQTLVVDYGLADSLVRMAEIVLSAVPAQFALAGHSMGGRVALEMYRLAPERVLRIALFDTGCGAKPAGEAGDREAQGRYRLLELARREGMRAMAQEWLPPMVHSDRHGDTALLEAIIGMIARKTPDIQAAQIKALLERPDATEVLRTIGCPALFLTGDADTWSTPAAHAEMASVVQKSKLVIVPDCGHMAMMERPEAVTAAMREWLAAPPGTG